MLDTFAQNRRAVFVAGFAVAAMTALVFESTASEGYLQAEEEDFKAVQAELSPGNPCRDQAWPRFSRSCMQSINPDREIRIIRLDNGEFEDLRGRVAILEKRISSRLSAARLPSHP